MKQLLGALIILLGAVLAGLLVLRIWGVAVLGQLTLLRSGATLLVLALALVALVWSGLASLKTLGRATTREWVAGRTLGPVPSKKNSRAWTNSDATKRVAGPRAMPTPRIFIAFTGSFSNPLTTSAPEIIAGLVLP